MLVNADSINMMFASLTLSGHLKSECSTSNDPNTGQPRTLGSLLPADCNSISPANDAAAALARGLCFGFRTANCEGLKGPGFFTTPVEQGTCHGMEGDNCDSIATGMSGIVMPDDCNTITIGGGDSTDPSRATDIARGRCFAIKGTNCETLSAGTDVDTPPAEQPVPDALALEAGVGDWTELMAALLTVGRAQGLLFAELAAAGDDAARRAFDRVGRDLAGHAALAFLEIRRGTFVDRARVEASLGPMVAATGALLAGTGVEDRWRDRLGPLMGALGLDLRKL